MTHAPIRATGGSGKDFELVPPGTHFAICTRVIYLGIQAEEFQNETKELPKVYLGFEVPDVQIEYQKNGKTIKAPAVIGRTFTLNIGAKSNLGPFLANWRAKPFTQEDQDLGFDITSLLGKVCNLGVVHKESGGKTYANITSAGAMLKMQNDAIEAGTLSVKPHNGLISFNADQPDPEVFKQLPKFLQEKIQNRITTTKTGKPLPGTLAGEKVQETEDFDDDIPF